MLRLTRHLEDGISKFLQNVRKLLPHYTASQPRRYYSSWYIFTTIVGKTGAMTFSRRFCQDCLELDNPVFNSCLELDNPVFNTWLELDNPVFNSWLELDNPVFNSWISKQ
jgi:hypothetical protein